MDKQDATSILANMLKDSDDAIEHIEVVLQQQRYLKSQLKALAAAVGAGDIERVADHMPSMRNAMNNNLQQVNSIRPISAIGPSQPPMGQMYRGNDGNFYTDVNGFPIQVDPSTGRPFVGGGYPTTGVAPGGYQQQGMYRRPVQSQM